MLIQASGSGNGGAGGATTGAPQGETGGAEAGRADSPAAQQAAAIQQAQLGLGLVSMKKDLAMKDAQIDEINATAAVKRAEAGLSTEKKITEIQTRDPLVKKLNAEVGNIKAGTAKMNAERELINTENSIRKVELDVKKATKESVIQTAYHGALKAHQEFLAAIENVRGMKADNEDVTGLKSITEAADTVRYGRGAFCKPVKVACKGCWRYQKCEC